MEQRIFALGAMACALLSGGCASIVGGSNQSLSVQTSAAGQVVSGANCSLSNDKGTWYLTTPGSAVVNRSFAELAVKCQKDSFEPGQQIVRSTTKAMAFGNIIFGGLIGVGVDVATGAAYDYPAEILVELVPVPGAAGRTPAAAGTNPAAATAPAPVADAARALEYRVTDRLTGTTQRVKLAALDPATRRGELPGVGELGQLAPPTGWVPASFEPGHRWTLKYAARDGVPASQVNITGQVGPATQVTTLLGQFEVVPVTYKGWIDRAAGPAMVGQPAEFRLWYDRLNQRVLRLESDIASRNVGPNQARASKEQAELVGIDSAAP